MTAQPTPPPGSPGGESPAQFALAAREFVEALLAQALAAGHSDGAEIVRSITAGLAAGGHSLADLHARLARDQLAIWRDTIGRSPTDGAPAAAPADRRFRDRAWDEHPYFDWLRRSYLRNAAWLEEVVENARLDAPTLRKARFFTRQFADAMAPSNFLSTNPEALRLNAESRGESVSRGMRNLAEDLRRGRISMTDESAFGVGRNIATTPGAVVFQNELIQLIQYDAVTPEVHTRPLLIVPPCINKFYILDLQPHNSFVRHALGLGHTVFMVSWRNIQPDQGSLTWDDYLELGVIAALEAARQRCGADKVNALGFCVGGTLLACAAAVLRARRRLRCASLSFLTTMLDFSDPGDISVYVDEPYVRRVEQEYRDGGLMPGRQLATTFASLRANELVWFYVVNNYLKGRTPDAFDLLYWNSDSTNLAGRMYAYYVRHMYLENCLREPGRLAMCGKPVDLGAIGLPAYVLATREDHIVPWKTAYASARLLRRRGRPAVDFVLAASGHIAGVVNPVSQNRRSYWTGAAAEDADAWLAGATEHPGSWWAHWGAWLHGHAGRLVPARAIDRGTGDTALETAPGSYVLAPCA